MDAWPSLPQSFGYAIGENLNTLALYQTKEYIFLLFGPKCLSDILDNVRSI